MAAHFSVRDAPGIARGAGLTPQYASSQETLSAALGKSLRTHSATKMQTSSAILIHVYSSVEASYAATVDKADASTKQHAKSLWACLRCIANKKESETKASHKQRGYVVFWKLKFQSELCSALLQNRLDDLGVLVSLCFLFKPTLLDIPMRQPKCHLSSFRSYRVILQLFSRLIFVFFFFLI
jgi:hypothetical protein